MADWSGIYYIYSMADWSEMYYIYSMADQAWDCIVVGAGIVGSWTAYHLAAAGKYTLMLDQVYSLLLLICFPI